MPIVPVNRSTGVPASPEPEPTEPRRRIPQRPSESEAPLPAAIPDQAAADLPNTEPANTEPPSTEPVTAEKKPRRRGVATRRADGKWQAPEGNTKGFACPPKEHQFTGKPGPGRPRGARSQKSYLREALDKPMALTIEGTARRMKRRQVAAELFVKTALENPDKIVMAKLLAQADELYPDRVRDEAAVSPLGDARLDQMVIAQYLAGLTLGEPDPGAAEPEYDPPPLGDPSSGTGNNDHAGDPWSEGDWHAPGADEPSADEPEDDNDDDDDDIGDDDIGDDGEAEHD
jgi:hypothetical protein